MQKTTSFIVKHLSVCIQHQHVQVLGELVSEINGCSKRLLTFRSLSICSVYTVQVYQIQKVRFVDKQTVFKDRTTFIFRSRHSYTSLGLRAYLCMNIHIISEHSHYYYLESGIVLQCRSEQISLLIQCNCF